VEPLYDSLERIVNIMGNWFTPEDVGYVPAIAQLIT